MLPERSSVCMWKPRNFRDSRKKISSAPCPLRITVMPCSRARSISRKCATLAKLPTGLSLYQLTWLSSSSARLESRSSFTLCTGRRK